VLLLNKSLFGLKQAPREWFQALVAFLLALGCVQSLSDGALFTFSDGGGNTVYILHYVDDIQIASKGLSRVLHFKELLLSRFPGKDLREAQFFLQKTVQHDRSKRIVVLKQQRHIEKLVETAGLQEAWPVKVPMISRVCRDVIGASITEPSAIAEFRSLLGALMHIANYIRPAIAFAV
jgi:Reverse transcriptase (RNA-dependent DNA polymerase)